MKSLEARKADRKRREQKAEQEQKEARRILAGGTVAGQEKTGDQDQEQETEGGDEKDYQSMTVAQLKAELDGREIEYSSDDRKDDLIELLEADDAE